MFHSVRSWPVFIRNLSLCQVSAGSHPPQCPWVILVVQIRAVVVPEKFCKKETNLPPPPSPEFREENKTSFGRVLIQTRPIPTGTSVLLPQEELRMIKRHREVGLQWMQAPCSLGFMWSPPAKNLITVHFPHGNPTQECLRWLGLTYTLFYIK